MNTQSKTAVADENWYVNYSTPADDLDAPDSLSVLYATHLPGTVGDLVCKLSPIGSIDERDLRNGALIAAAPALLRIAKRHLFLHTCEQEGIESGMPDPSEWFDAVEELAAIIKRAETPIDRTLLE